MAQVLELPPLKGRSGPLNEGGDVATRADKTTLPNWFMPILAGIIIALFGFVYTTVDRRLDELKTRIATQETWMQNTREKLIEHGWTVDDAGRLKPPPRKAEKE